MIAAAGSIRQVRAFGDDPFESESARMLQYGWPVHIEMLAKANGRAGRQYGEKLLQQVFTVLENHFCQIEPFTVENVEDEVAEPVGAAGLQIGLQIVEARNAARIVDDDLAVDQRRAKTKRLQCVGNTQKAFGPVELFARQEANFAPVDPRLHAVAVVFDLMDPFRAARRLFALRSQARFEENREQPRASTGKFGDDWQESFPRFGRHGSGLVILAHLTRRRELFVGAAAELRRRHLIG